MIVLGRDQVSLIEVYVLAGYVVWHWCSGAGRAARLIASIKPLAAACVAGALIVTVPVTLTALLATDSNRPEISYVSAGAGSLHPVDLLMLVFADVFGASDFSRELWGPPGLPWQDAFGPMDLYVAQNVGQVYLGALAVVALIAFGLVRGALWDREMRYFSIAIVLTVLYALGRYTPVFHLMYDFVPGVSLYRRPADATFVFCALLALAGGYLVHRFLTGAFPPLRRWQRALEIAIAAALLAFAVGLAWYVGQLAVGAMPIAWGGGFAIAAIGSLMFARKLAPRSAFAAAAILTVFSAADLAFNNAPNESTGLPRSQFDALKPDTADETVTLLKDKLKAATAPDRRDRVELIGIAYHWPNIGLIHDFDQLFGHNPLRLDDFQRATDAEDTVAIPEQRKFTKLLPSYRSPLEDLFGVRFIAIGVPIEKVDPSLKPGDVTLIGRTKDAYVYENPRALPRVLLATSWRKADFDAMLRAGGWPDVDPRHTVLLEREPRGAPAQADGGTVKIADYQNTDIEIEADAPGGGFVVLNDMWHPWWRATVDGTPTDILKANVLFRAVAVPPGKHVVRFTFHPFSGGIAELKNKLASMRH